MVTKSPLHKRIRLDPSASPSPPPRDDVDEAKRKQKKDENSVSGDAEHDEPFEIDDEEDEDHCVICLHRIQDRTVLPCAHDRLCFDCIFVWCQQSRKCPLCNAPIGPFLIHNFRSKYDYSKYYLHPLRVSSPTSASVPEPLLGVGLSRVAARVSLSSTALLCSHRLLNTAFVILVSWQGTWTAKSLGSSETSWIDVTRETRKRRRA